MKFTFSEDISHELLVLLKRFCVSKPGLKKRAGILRWKGVWETLEATFPVIKAADLYSRMHRAKTKVKEIIWFTTEIVWFTTEIYKIHSVNTVSFYTKVEIIKWNPCTLVSKPEKMCLKHTVKLWNVLLQYIFYDNRLHRFKITIMKLIGAKSYKDCWTQINYLWLKGSLNYNFTVQLFRDVPSHLLLTTTRQKIVGLNYMTHFHSHETFKNHITWTRLKILQSLWRKSVSILGSWIIILAA